MMKKVLLFILLLPVFHLTVAQVLPHAHKTARNNGSQNTLAKAELRNRTLLIAYEPKPPHFDFKSAGQKSKSPDTSKSTCRCSCSKRFDISTQPLILVLSHKRSFKTNSLNSIKPEWIKSINVLKDSIQTSQYGQDRKNGVVLIMINDETHPAVYRELKRRLSIYNTSALLKL